MKSVTQTHLFALFLGDSFLEASVLLFAELGAPLPFTLLSGYSCALLLWLSPELGLCLCYLILVFLGRLLVLVGYITPP